MTSNGKVHVTEIPMNLAFKGEWKTFTFSSPALFHSRLAGLANELEFLRSYSSRIQDLQRQMSRVINYTAELSLDPYVVTATLRGVGEGIGSIIVAEGTAVGNIFQGIGRGTKKLLDGILKGPVQVIVNALVFLLILIIIGFLVYTYGASRVFRFCRRRPASEPQPQTVAEQVRPPEQIPLVPRQTIQRPQARRTIYKLGNPSASLIKIKIGETETQALWDTGADITLINSTLFDQLKQNINIKKISSIPPTIQSITGKDLTVENAVPLKFTIGKEEKQHVTWVVKLMEPACIIGTDLQTKFGPFTMYHQNQTLILHNQEPKIPSETSVEPIKTSVNLFESTYSPARSH